MTGIKENGIKHCYRSDKGNMLLKPSPKVLFVNFGWGATFKSQRMDVKCRKMQMAAFFGKSLFSQPLHYLESHVWGQYIYHIPLETGFASANSSVANAENDAQTT